MQTTCDLPEPGTTGVQQSASVPRGPRGLWSALANASTSSVMDRALPTTDLSLLGTRLRTAMFDYDPALAVSLGDELDVALFLA